MAAFSAATALPGIGDLAGMLKGGVALAGMTAYHGSPHLFDAFDLSKIGTGEGAQAYGHGIYLAESPGVAKNYQIALSPEFEFNGEEEALSQLLTQLINANIQIIHFTEERHDLEEVFMRVTKGLVT